MKAVDLEIDSRKVERRKDERRRVWRYQKVDHIPVIVDLYPTCGFTARERYEDFEAWYACNLESIRRSLATLPDDYIPSTHLVWGGDMTIATMFGASLYWSSDPDQDPSVAKRLITDVAQIYGLPVPDPVRDGRMPENLRWMRLLAERLPQEVHLAGLDMTGPLANTFSMMDEQLFYIALKEEPEAVHHLLSLVTRTILACEQALVEAAGGVERMPCIDYSSIWQPEGHKGYVSDDISAHISPAMFESFSLPWGSRILQRWPGGLLHNCGPHPSAHLYLHHDPPLDGLNCSFKFTRSSFPALREAFGRRAQEELGRRGHLEVLLHEMTAEEMVAAFRNMMEALAPDVYAIPICWLQADEWLDDDITDLYWQMRRVAEEFAASMRWEREDTAERPD